MTFPAVVTFRLDAAQTEPAILTKAKTRIRENVFGGTDGTEARV